MKDNKIISKNTQLLINIIASFITLVVSMGISFFLSPFIVKKLGAEAYGFVQLANNFIAYFSILTIALNSMSSRFISISYFRKDIVEANQYYTSNFFSNLLLCVIFTPILILGTVNIDKLIEIPINLLTDVQLLIAFMGANFLISMISTNLGISYYIKNKLYISSIISIIGHFIRAILLYLLFLLCKPSVFYMGLVTVIISIFTISINLIFKYKMIPDLNVSSKYFSIKKTSEMIMSGMWNSITRLGNMLSEGLDLLITNIFISSMDMGILAIAKTVPNMINSILNSLISTFMPNLTELYANNKVDDLIKTIRQSMKIIGMIINIPIALLIAYGDILFSLWFPTQNAELLQILSIITIFPWAVIGQATIIHNLFTVLNKIKINSILVCLTGLLNVLVVFILLKTTSLGLFAVAGVSTIFSILRNLIYTVPFGAIYINQKWYIFFPEIFKSVVSVIIISLIGSIIKMYIYRYSWKNLIAISIITTIIGIGINLIIVLNREDRINIKQIIIGKFNKIYQGGINNGYN